MSYIFKTTCSNSIFQNNMPAFFELAWHLVIFLSNMPTLARILHGESTILISPCHTQLHPTCRIHNSHSTTPHSTTPHMANPQFSFHHAILNNTLHGRFTILFPPCHTQLHPTWQIHNFHSTTPKPP